MSKIVKKGSLREFTSISLVNISMALNEPFYSHVTNSGHGKDGIRVETEEGENSRGETVELAKEASGECVIGNKLGGRADSIHDLKLELLKLKTDKITMTLDCCRNVTRSIVDLK